MTALVIIACIPTAAIIVGSLAAAFLPDPLAGADTDNTL